MTDVTIAVRHNGPLKLTGPITIVDAEGVPFELPPGTAVVLCRCGHSSQKPFCDNTHARIGFDGTETAPTAPSATRARRFTGAGITMTDDSIFCMHAGFCGNHVEK